MKKFVWQERSDNACGPSEVNNSFRLSVKSSEIGYETDTMYGHRKRAVDMQSLYLLQKWIFNYNIDVLNTCISNSFYKIASDSHFTFWTSGVLKVSDFCLSYLPSAFLISNLSLLRRRIMSEYRKQFEGKVAIITGEASEIRGATALFSLVSDI